MSYKWISKEIEQLDPEKDYVRIWQLSSCYHVDDTLFNLLYALGLPRITQNPHGSELLAKRTRKGIDQKHQRANDTLSHFWTWYEFGPDHPYSQKSIEFVNLIHKGLAKKYPEAFPDEDYVYTVCMLATSPNDLRKKLGLSEFSEKQKISTHHYWRDLLSRMQGQNGAIKGFPDDYQGMVEVVKEHDSKEWPVTDAGSELTENTIRQFCEANFPNIMQGFGRQLYLVLQEPHIRRLRETGEPNPIAAPIVKSIVRLKTMISEYLLPDPKMSVPERARLKGDLKGQHKNPDGVDSEINISDVSIAPGGVNKKSKCPFH